MRADALRNRARILAAAEAAIADGGAIVATDEVAQRADVGVATVFRHFPTKKVLLQATLAWHLESLADKIEGLAAPEQSDRAVRTLFEELVRTSAVRELLLAEVGRSGPLDEASDRARAQLDRQVDGVLEAARERGRLRSGVDRDVLFHLARGLSLTSDDPAAPAAFALVIDAIHAEDGAAETL